MMSVIHGVPPESAHLQRCRAEVVDRQDRLTRNLVTLHADMDRADASQILLADSLTRLAQALTIEADAKDSPL